MPMFGGFIFPPIILVLPLNFLKLKIKNNNKKNKLCVTVSVQWVRRIKKN